MVKQFVLLISSCIGLTCFAAPVIDLSQASNSNQQALVHSGADTATTVIDTSDMSVEERLARLENLVNAQAQMLMTQRLQQVQQQVEILQGQNEVLQHEVKRLKTRQQYLYQQLSAGDKVSMPTQADAFTNNTAKDQQAYQQAYILITQSHYDAASKALAAFVKKYPKSQYVPQALYWQGEVSSAQGNTAQAEAALQQLVSQYPNDKHVLDAQLKLATLAMNSNETDKAKTLLDAIIKDHPDSAAASIAANKLRILKG